MNVDGYGTELFFSFVPPALQARASGIAVLSGALVKRLTADLGPTVEIPHAHTALTIGALRAVKHAGALATVSVDAEARLESPQAPSDLVDEVLQCARTATFVGPLVLLARAHDLELGASIDRLRDAMARDVSAGFTSLAVSGDALFDDIEELGRVADSALEQDLGVELELGKGASILLARIVDMGFGLTAVRGAGVHNDVGDAIRVQGAGGALDPPARVLLDAALDRAVRRAVPGRTLLDVERAPRDAALRLEAYAYTEVLSVCLHVGAGGVVAALLDKLANGHAVQG